MARAEGSAEFEAEVFRTVLQKGGGEITHPKTSKSAYPYTETVEGAVEDCDWVQVGHTSTLRANWMRVMGPNSEAHSHSCGRKRIVPQKELSRHA